MPSADDAAHTDGTSLSPIARQLRRRVDTDEPLEGVIKDLLDALDELAAQDLAELLSSIGRRHNRDAGRVPPDSQTRQR